MTADRPFEWQDPPEPVKPGPKPGIWDRVAERAKKEPGRWAHVGTVRQASGAVAAQKAGLETTVRRIAPNRFDLYVRWPEQESDPR